MQLGEKIKKIRRLKGFRQSDMAKKLRISQAAYSRIEREEVKIYLSTLDNIAKIFKLEIVDILNFDEKSSENLHSKKKTEFETLKTILIKLNKEIGQQKKEIQLLKKKIKSN